MNDYLFKESLMARKTAPLRQQMSNGAFYPLLGVGRHTFAEWKVIFKDLTEVFQCCVLGPEDSSMSGKPLLADYTLRLIPTATEDEAHYFAALLNSSPCAAALYYSSTGVQTQRYHAADAEKVSIRRYSGTRQDKTLVRLSKQCHAAAKKDDWKRVEQLELEIDKAAAEYWKISDPDLRNIQRGLVRVKNSNRPLAPKTEGSEESQ